MLASDFPEAIRLAREALPLVEALRLDGLQVRALEVLGVARALSGDAGGLDDSKRAIALARERNAVAQLAVAEDNLYAAQFALGQLDAAVETLQMHLSDVTRYGSAADKAWARGAQAYQAVLHGRWDEALGIIDELLTELERAVPYLKSTWYAHRGSIELARGDIADASRDSYEALEIARRAKDPQILAPAIALRAIVLNAEGRPAEASQLASEVLAFRHVSSVLMQERPAATLIEFTWLLRDLGREEDLLLAVASDPSTPWLDTARTIADGAFVRAVELVTRIGAPSVEAYMRLRVAEELVRAGQHEQAREALAPAIAFFENVGARQYLDRAEQLLTSA
jgi:tetratricopeptide (TPR) repeat protein